MNIELSLDKTTVKACEIIEIKWTCEDADSAQISINNGYKQVVTDVPISGSKKIRLNRSKGKTRITLTATKGEEKFFKSEDVKVKKRWFWGEEDIIKDEASQTAETIDGCENVLENIIVSVMGLFISLLVFAWTRRIVPDLHWILSLDRILELFVIILVIEKILSYFKRVTYVVFFLLLAKLTIGSIKKYGYGFKEFGKDYVALCYDISHYYKPKTSKPQAKKSSPIPHNPAFSFDFVASQIKKAVDYKHDTVKLFANRQTTDSLFMEIRKKQRSANMRTIVDALSVFKTVNNQWEWRNDPYDCEFFSKASKTIENKSNGVFTGDCDDHAILMAACVMAVGAKARIVLAPGHAYPELYLGSQTTADSVNRLIGQLFDRPYGFNIFTCHKDKNNKLWLNLDYTANYPGGHFMHDSDTIDYIINLP
jgi:hypothetical protein